MPTTKRSPTAGLLLLAAFFLAVVSAGCGNDGSSPPDLPGRRLDCGETREVFVTREPVEDQSLPQPDAAMVQAGLDALNLFDLAAEVRDPIPETGTEGFIRLGDSLVVYAENGETLARFDLDGAEVCVALQG